MSRLEPLAGTRTVFHAIGLIVLTLAGSQISEMARFDTGALPAFGLPRKRPP